MSVLAAAMASVRDGVGVVVVLWSSVCEQGYNWPLLSRQKLDFMMG